MKGRRSVALPAFAIRRAWRRMALRAEDKPGAAGRETRGAVRRRTHLRSAKILDGAGAFLCEALIQDQSASGLRLLLARNIGLPSPFGVHDDATGEIVTAALVWRRERTVGAQVLSLAPPPALRAAQRAALAGPYYGVRG